MDRFSGGLMRLPVIAAIVLLCLTPFASAAGPAKPNVLIILADDMGYSDAGCYGGEIQTPNLDRLAANGLRFTQFYNTARCWPSRAALLTGYYAQQVRRDAIPGIGGGGQGIRPAWGRLLPEMLKPLGYRSYHSGKWHVDGGQIKGGFDRSYMIQDQDRHFSPRTLFLDDVKLPAVEPGSGFYAPAAIGDHAVKWLREHAEQHKDKPFFEYLAFTTPHFPIQATPEDIARYTGKYDAGWDAIRAQRWKRQREMGLVNCALPEPDVGITPGWNLAEAALQQRIGPAEVGYAVAWDKLTKEQKQFQAAKMAVHAAMIDRIDREIGRVLEQIEKMGATRNTIVLFASDNGASAEQIIRGDGHEMGAAVGSAKSYLGIGPGWSTAANTPFRLHKSWVHEGGIATPMIVSWPAGIAAKGELRHGPGHLIDVTPTILELASGKWPQAWDGVPVPPPPGKSMTPAFAKDGPARHEYLWWYHVGNRAIRIGDWKLVAAGEKGPWELYDLSRDRCEMQDLAAKEPQRVREMEQAWTARLAEFRELAMKDAPPGGLEKPRKKKKQE
jgi:arylsulfatase A-like enzyme